VRILISIRLGCAQSAATKAMLSRLGICVVERHWRPDEQDTAPIVSIELGIETVTWHGHQPDCIAMLAELCEMGSVPAHGLGSLEEEHDAILTRGQVVMEIERHGADAGEFFSECGEQPLYRGETILNWLGY